MIYRPLGVAPGPAICYSGYREGQSPDSQTYPAVTQIREDLRRIGFSNAAFFPERLR